MIKSLCQLVVMLTVIMSDKQQTVRGCERWIPRTPQLLTKNSQPRFCLFPRVAISKILAMYFPRIDFSIRPSATVTSVLKYLLMPSTIKDSTLPSAVGFRCVASKSWRKYLLIFCSVEGASKKRASVEEPGSGSSCGKQLLKISFSFSHNPQQFKST